ncbi:MAG: nucleoside recognition domain-containing protein [Halobacteriota archaeon]|nr:nucleoside recognition domain-containing protein [Halobacteriota archaeon]
MIDIATYLIRATILITVGIVLANIALETNILNRLSTLVVPLSKTLNLPKASVFSLLTSFLSPTAGKSVLSEFYKDGDVSDREAIVTVVMSTFPVVFSESLLRAQAPIALILLGPRIGGIYIALRLLSSFLQSFAAFIYSRFFLPGVNFLEDEKKYDLKEIDRDPPCIKTALKRSFRTLKRVIPILIITFIVIFILSDYGVMDQVALFFEPILKSLGIPGESATALIAQFIHYSAGYATVALLLVEGVLTEKQAIITLLIGSMLGITMMYLRYSLSMYLSLFGRFGLKMVAINYSSSMIAKVIMILLVTVAM